MLGPLGAGTEQPSCRPFRFSRGGNLCPPAMLAKIWAVGVGRSAEHRLPVSRSATSSGAAWQRCGRSLPRLASLPLPQHAPRLLLPLALPACQPPRCVH